MGEQIVCSNCLSNADSGLPACPYCGQSFENTNPAGTLPVNTLLAGRYTIGRVLALDGEGVLYAAIDNSATRRVVVKEYVPVTICAARSRDGSVIPRQGREVLFKTTRMDFVDLYRSLVALGRNDGLVQVLDLIEENNTAYAVREPDEGTPLLTYLEQRAQPLTQSEALLLLRPVVYGVEAMHRMGLLHRGISPETVFITKTGSAKLSGYATLGLRTADSELKSQMFDGYAAPEQYAVAEFDGKYTDIYGLGALFYRVLTGKTPVPANLRRMNDTLPPAHTVDKEIPGFVSAAIARAMRLAPGERMQSASDLLAAITAPEKDEGGFRLTQRQIKFLALGAAGLVLVAAVSIWAIVSASGGGEASSSSSSSSSSGTSVSSGSSEVEVFTVPSFVGKKYTDLASNQAYTKYVSFLTEHEFSNDYKAGEVMRQSHPQGTQVAVGTVITLTVSDGPETAVMPEVLGRPQADVEADLKALKIKYALYPLVNDGSYVAGTVARSDTDKGTVVEIGKTTVTLYIAGRTAARPLRRRPLPETARSRRLRYRPTPRRRPATRARAEKQAAGARPKADAAPRSDKMRNAAHTSSAPEPEVPGRCCVLRGGLRAAVQVVIKHILLQNARTARVAAEGEALGIMRGQDLFYMGVDRKCIHMMQTEQADTVRYLGSNPLYGAQRRVRFRIGHGAQCIQRVRLCKVRACGTQVFRAVAQAKGAQRFRLRRRQCSGRGEGAALHGAQVP